MRPQSHAEEDSAAGVILTVSPRMPWRVAAVEAQRGFTLHVRFNDGLEGRVDLSALVHGEDAGVFAALTDERLFSQAYVAHGAVTWPGDLDLAPDAMYRAIKSSGTWVL